MSIVEKIKLWFERLWFAQHNARVLADMEWRFILALEDATNGRMSKAYYDIEVIRQCISEARQETYQEGYEDGCADSDPAAE